MTQSSEINVAERLRAEAALWMGDPSAPVNWKILTLAADHLDAANKRMAEMEAALRDAWALIPDARVMAWGKTHADVLKRLAVADLSEEKA